jgi:hypothetical protein
VSFLVRQGTCWIKERHVDFGVAVHLSSASFCSLPASSDVGESVSGQMLTIDTDAQEAS